MGPLSRSVYLVLVPMPHFRYRRSVLAVPCTAPIYPMTIIAFHAPAPCTLYWSLYHNDRCIRSVLPVPFEQSAKRLPNRSPEGSFFRRDPLRGLPGVAKTIGVVRGGNQGRGKEWEGVEGKEREGGGQ